MPLSITPKSEKDVGGAFENLPPGEYPFTVMESGIAVSQSEKNPGREFVKVKLCVHGDGYDRHVYDQFADWFSEWKLKHFCEVVGLGKEYLRGQISPDNNAWKDWQGYCKIGVRPARGEYEAQNEVKDYLPEDEQKVDGAKPESAHKPASKAPTPPAEEDDVPF